ncbi:MAG: MBL fold metallo-hydrolase [Acidobacteriota bacterium]
MMRKSNWVFLGALAAGSLLFGLQAAQKRSRPGLEVLYLANAGVLIRSGGQSVLIDGLFRPYRFYAHLPAEQSQALEAAQAPFGGADLILVSHIHGDHFHPQSVSNYLSRQEGSILATSEQAAAAVLSTLRRNAESRKRLVEINPAAGKKEKRKFGQIEVTFLGLPHGSPRQGWIQNLGHLIRMGGKTLLHVGDAELSSQNFQPFKLSKEKIDIAFLPYWYLLSEEGRQLVDAQIRPRRIVALHVLPRDAEEVCGKISQALPEAVCWKEPLQAERF